MNMDVVLIDTSHLLYRSWHTFKELQNKAGMPTGMFFGVMRTIEHLHKICPNSALIFVFDGYHKHRAEFYPQYKANRTGEMETGYGQMVHEVGMKIELINFIHSTGAATAYHPDYECDDLVAMVAHHPRQYLGLKYDPTNVYIYSGDDDFCQLVSARVNIIKPPAGRNQPERWMDIKQVQAEWSVHPESLALYRSFTGDSGDNIPGLPRTPRARLQMAVKDKISPEQFYNGDGLAYFNPDWKNKLTLFRPQAEINYRLTRLPWDYLPEIRFEFDGNGLNLSNLTSALTRYEFSSFLKKIGALEESLAPTAHVKILSSVVVRPESGQDQPSGLGHPFTQP